MNEEKMPEQLSDKEKTKQIKSLESAIARLQSVSTKTTVTDIKEQENEIAESAKKLSEIANHTNSNVDIEYKLDKDELNPSILSEDVLTEKEDIKKNKSIAWLAYILFFIPLLINKKSPFVRLHANEGLDIFIIDVIAGTMMACGKLIPFSQKLAIIGHLLFLAGLGLIALTTITKIFQIIKVFMGKKSQTPWLWKTRLIK